MDEYDAIVASDYCETWQYMLCCPRCGCAYVHHQKVEVFEREDGLEDAPSFKLEPGMLAREPAENPSPRRNAVRIHFWGECDHEWTLDIVQHKGQTFVAIPGVTPDLATMPYHEYLKTPHWRAIREAALERADHRCQICYSADGLEVHHRTYARRGCEEPADVTVLCRSCHSLFHQPAEGRPTRTVR